MARIGEIMQKLVMSNPKTGMWFLSHMPASFWEKQGRKKTLTVFHEAAEKVPAYQKFLREKGINPKEITTFEDFQKKVPIMNKEDYILKYSLAERCLETKLDKMYTMAASSGSTGESIFWPRLPEQDLMLPKYWELFFLQNWDIDKHSTLIIVGMALGNWIAGELATGVCKRLAIEGKYPLTIATPGSDLEQICDVIKNIGANYEQVLLLIYPSFLKALFEKGEARGIDWKSLNIKLWVGGERLSPNLKRYILEKLGIEKEELNRIQFVYGTVDAGGIGFSSPLSKLVTRLSLKDDSLAQAVFGKTISLPTLVQYNPLAYFLETINGELVITYKGGVPIIRYNIHDEGRIIPYKKMLKILKEHGYDSIKLLEEEGYTRKKVWAWPFVYITGRSSNVVQIGGLNVYPENIEAALYTEETEDINSFRLKVETDKEGNSRFYILVELKEGISLTLERQLELERKYHDIFLNKLLERNREYKKAYHEIDKKTVDPVIKVYQFSQGPFTEKIATKDIYINK